MEDPVELLGSKAELDQEEMERLLRENRALKGRLDELERENRLLKQRNFDLSMRYGRSVENRRQPFEIEKKSTRDSEDRHGAGAGGGAGGGAGSGAGSSSRRKEAKQLKCYAELDGHEGAIYSTQYSPIGNLIVSASFDRTVRVWDIREQKPVAVLESHQQSVFDVAWREDSAAVVSASFDRTCIEWDIESKAAATRLQCSGLVQCVRYSTHNPRVVYAGDSSGFISIHDTRQPQEATKLSNDGAMVNTMFCFNDETRLVSGDRNGEIKMWDVRIGKFMRLVSADAQKQAISHISVVKNEKSGTEYMAVNSYDNALRVYDRVDDPSVPTPRVIHELRGVRNRNWPIKNAFFDPRLAQEQLLGLYNDDYYELDTRSQNEARGLRSMLFLITGSAEPFAYLYRLSTHSKTIRMDDKVRPSVCCGQLVWLPTLMRLAAVITPCSPVQFAMHCLAKGCVHMLRAIVQLSTTPLLLQPPLVVCVVSTSAGV
ncbi:WD40 repeat-like protein [Martensiomyces pterosporus]|nr:WD40 repeat-like protein [Martensiomyces pterosporus]